MPDASSGDKLKIALFGDLSLEEAMDLSRDRQILELVTCCTLFSSLSYYFTLRMEETCFSETSVDFQRTTRRYIQEYRTLHVRPCFGVRRTILRHVRFSQRYVLPSSCTLKMEAAVSSETLVPMDQSARRHRPVGSEQVCVMMTRVCFQRPQHCWLPCAQGAPKHVGARLRLTVSLSRCRLRRLRSRKVTTDWRA
jgi:hypothetical protein